MIDKVVYIPSRRRAHNLAKILPRWYDQGYYVFLVIERPDLEAYHLEMQKDINAGRYRILVLPESDQGIGYARNWIVAHADGRYKSFIMADDDVMPKKLVGNNGWRDAMVRLQKVVESDSLIVNGIVGCAAVHSYQDWLTQGFLKKDYGSFFNPDLTLTDHEINKGAAGRPCLAPNGSFGQCFAINTERAIKIGGFDTRLSVGYEDNDFMMRSITAGNPWTFHSGVWMDRLGGRFESGGIADLCGMPDKRSGPGGGDGTNTMPDLTNTEYEQNAFMCRQTMAHKWPDYTSRPDGRVFRISWKKLYDGQIPSWKALSAIHGGNLK